MDSLFIDPSVSLSVSHGLTWLVHFSNSGYTENVRGFSRFRLHSVGVSVSTGEGDSVGVDVGFDVDVGFGVGVGKRDWALCH